MYQQAESISKLLAEYPEFLKIATVGRRKYQEPTGPGRRPKHKDFELYIEFVSDKAKKTAENPGVYIFIEQSDTRDFYIGHAGLYESSAKGFHGRWARYKGGLNQTNEDTNKTLAEHVFSRNFDVYFFSNPTANFRGDVDFYVGEDLETLLIRKYNPIFNKRNR